MKPLTKREKEIQEELSILNNKSRWFCVEHPFKCKLYTLRVGWYEKTATCKLNNGTWVHDVKLRDTKDKYKISDVDYLKIIDTFKEKNIHLF